MLCQSQHLHAANRNYNEYTEFFKKTEIIPRKYSTTDSAETKH